jgi:lyso-ornithine lipid O-acyltransferase
MEGCTISWDTESIEKIKKSPADDRSRLRALFRLARYFGITLIHVLHAATHNLTHASTDNRSGRGNPRLLQCWASNINQAMGLTVTMQGTPPDAGVLLVSNHRSYMDITAIGELAPVTFLAKQEVARWPVLGRGCRLVDVVFVDRDSADSRRRSKDEVARRLWNNISIVVFPEGTSHEGPGLLTFKPGIFQVAAMGRFPIMPVAVNYEDPSDAWVGNDRFLRHFLQAFSKRQIHVTVTFGPVIIGDDPFKLMKSSWKWIYTTLVPEEG